MKLLIKIINKFKKKKMETYLDFIQSIIFPLLSIFLFYIFTNNLIFIEVNRIQSTLISLVFIYFFVWPVIKYIFLKPYYLIKKKKKKIKTHNSFIVFYSTLLLNSLLIQNPIVFLLLITPIIGKDSYLYLSIAELIQKSSYYIFLKSKLEEKV